MCFILFALGFWCCCFIPVLPCAKKWGFRDHQHMCPNCRALVSLKRHDIRSRYKIISEDPLEKKWDQIKGAVAFDAMGQPTTKKPNKESEPNEEVEDDDD